jgi:hypothetical protein
MLAEAGDEVVVDGDAVAGQGVGADAGADDLLEPVDEPPLDGPAFTGRCEP